VSLKGVKKVENEKSWGIEKREEGWHGEEGREKKEGLRILKRGKMGFSPRSRGRKQFI